LSYQQDAIATEAYFGTARRASQFAATRGIDYSLFEGRKRVFESRFD
jgi:hypothetical protein